MARISCPRRLFSSLHNLVEETKAFLLGQNASINEPDNLLLLKFVYWATPRLEAQRSRAYCKLQMCWEMIITKVRSGPAGDTLISRELMEHSTKAWRSAVEALGQTSDPAAKLVEDIEVPNLLLIYIKKKGPNPSI